MAVAVLRLSDAPSVGLTKDQVYARVANGSLERVGRGVFVDPDKIDAGLASLAAATAVHPKVTLCLTSALVWHDLSDMIPFTTNIALPRGIRHPAGFEHVTWHSFATETFEIGRTLLETVDGIDMFTYSAERTIIDSFRLAHRYGPDAAVEALKRWLRGGGQPSNLLMMARSFPRVATRIRETLEILL
jgi:predicted transcriptional regulator of viral defense system